MSSELDLNDEARGNATGGAVRRALRRGWPLVVVVVLAAVGASMLAASLRAPEYEASARLLVSPLSQGDTQLFGTDLIRETGDAQLTPATVAVLLESRAAAAETARRLGGNWTADSVLDAVRVEPIDDTHVLSVTARADSPKAAAALATGYAQAVIDVRARTIQEQLRERYVNATARRRAVPDDDYNALDRLMTEIRMIETTRNQGGDPTLRLADVAEAPQEEVRRSLILIAGVGLLGGLAVGIGAAMLLDRLRRPAPVRELVTR
jgi:uncharacterized protein involved in exopolysaccharide biosynthesis